MHYIHATWAGALNEIGDACLADSARWFPELHARGPVALVVHYTLGLVGEVGELVEATTAVERGEVAHDDERAELAHELADVTIYLLDLGRSLGIDLPAAVLLTTATPDVADAAMNAEDEEDVLRHVGTIANQVKKLNRGDRTIPQVAEAIGPTIGRMIAISINHAEHFQMVLPACIAAKHEILEGRWG